MRDRMQFLRFMYTCLFESSEFGGTCIDSLIFHFPIDLEEQNNMNMTGYNDTFMFAGAVKVSPIVNQVQLNQTTFMSHFPKGRWVNLATLNVLDAQMDALYNLSVSEATTVTKHLRPGYMIPWQDLNLTGDFWKAPINDRVSQTEDLIKRPINLVINRDTQKTAKGTLFLDQGTKQSEIIQKKYEYYQFTHKSTKSIQFELVQGTRGLQDNTHSLDSIIIADAADLASTDFACGYTQAGNIIQLEQQYSPATQSLRIFANANSLDYPLKFSKISNIFYGSSVNRDLNLCSESQFEYRMDAKYDNQTVLTQELSKPEATFRLYHKTGVLPDLSLTLRVFDEGIINVKWTWPEDGTLPADKRKHFEIPTSVVNTTRASRVGDMVGKHVIIKTNPLVIQFTQQQGQTPVYFEIDRIIYDSYLNWIGMNAFTMYTDQSYKGVMGLGERSQQSLFYNDGIYSMWNTDQPPLLDTGVPPSNQGYGTHPFFMWPHSDNKWVGVFFKQAHAQDWIIENDKVNGVTQLKQVATGGITDIYVMVNSNTPDSVVSYYHRIVGKPFLPPVWALGWHQSKVCLRTLVENQDVVEKYNQYRIPLDVQYVGSTDYTDNYRVFTVDPRYGNLKTYVSQYLKKNNTLKFVPNIMPNFAMREGYRTYTEGRTQNVFLKAPLTNRDEIYQGQGGANEAAFPDFSKVNTSIWWQNELTQFYKDNVEFDGIWLDKNEPSNQCNGICVEKQRPVSSMQDSFFYTPTGRYLDYKTLPVDLKRSDGATHLDAHNYYGTEQSIATFAWFKNPQQGISKQRPFILGRSSFSGVGKYSATNFGDNPATYDSMQRSVTEVMMKNMFGVPFAGANICGYYDTDSNVNTAQLCARWHQLGALQPFSRQHTGCASPRKDPGMFANIMVPGLNGVSYTDIMRDAILTKYSLQRYFYSELFKISVLNAGVGTIYKPLFFSFPNDQMAYTANPSENVMIGPSLKLSIKTTPVNNTVSDTNMYYFPKGSWCDILHPMDVCVVSDGTNMQRLKAGVQDFQLHLKDGEILVYQNASEIASNATRFPKGLRSEYMQEMPVDLHIHPTDVSTDRNKTVRYQARGSFINDNGVETEVSSETYNSYTMVFNYIDDVNNQTNDEQIRLTIGVNNQASRYYTNETKCSSINMNDQLGRIFIYDNDEFFAHPIYILSLIMPDFTYQELGIAKFDPLTNRLVYDPNYISNQGKGIPTSLCLSNIYEIRFEPIPL